MKIKPEVYESMRNDIIKVAEKTGVFVTRSDGGKTGLKTMWALLAIVSQNRAYDDSHPNFVNGNWKRLLPCDKREYCFYYADNCNDEHVATALRRIKEDMTQKEYNNTHGFGFL